MVCTLLSSLGGCILIKDDEMNWSCSTHGSDGKYVRSTLAATSGENNRLKRLGVDERIILKWIVRKL
jgi:hypothetical protein